MLLLRIFLLSLVCYQIECFVCTTEKFVEGIYISAALCFVNCFSWKQIAAFFTSPAIESCEKDCIYKTQENSSKRHLQTECKPK